MQKRLKDLLRTLVPELRHVLPGRYDAAEQPRIASQSISRAVKANFALSIVNTTTGGLAICIMSKNLDGHPQVAVLGPDFMGLTLDAFRQRLRGKRCARSFRAALTPAARRSS